MSLKNTWHEIRGKVIASLVTAVIIGIPSGGYWFYTENAWASEVTKSLNEITKEAKEKRLTNLRRELNEISLKIQDGADTKYDRLRKEQLERDYDEELDR